MPAIPALTTISGEITAAPHNNNYSTIRTNVNDFCVFVDVASQVITKTITFTPDAGAGFIVSTGGITVTGNSTITGTLGSLTGLTVASGGIAVTGNSTISGTLGSLTGLTVASGGVTVTGNSTITGTLGGLTGLTVASGGLTVTAGGATITDGNLALNSGQANLTRFDAGDSGTSLTINFNDGNVQRVRLTGNCTFTFTNPVVGASYVLEVLQDGTGSRLATWPATVKWDRNTAPVLTTTINQKDVVVFLWNGTNYIGGIFATGVADTT